MSFLNGLLAVLILPAICGISVSILACVWVLEAVETTKHKAVSDS